MDILICDDDKQFVDKFSKDIENFCKQINRKCQIVKKSYDFFKSTNYKFDVVFMDINLVEGNGIELADTFKKKSPETLIIFISSRSDLIFDTLSIGIFQFIRKNEYEKDFIRVMKQINDYYNKKENYVLININKRTTKIILSHVVYIISIGKEIIIKCYDTEYVIKATLKQVLEQMNYCNFIQIQRSLVINLEYIDEFIKWDVRCNNNTFKIGRKYQKEFLKAYEGYLIQ